MRKRRKKKPENGSNWMDTYGDMVTLLLCFFVLLYSISSVDQSKWIKLVESFNPDAKEVSQIVTDTVADGNDEVPGSAEATEEAVFDGGRRWDRDGSGIDQRRWVYFCTVPGHDIF